MRFSDSFLAVAAKAAIRIVHANPVLQGVNSIGIGLPAVVGSRTVVARSQNTSHNIIIWPPATRGS